MKKYQLTDESMEMFGRKLYRIKAVKSFGDVEEGTLGGFVENETNLSHFGNAWIAGDAVVCEHGWVEGNAIVDDHAIIRGNAIICGNSAVSDFATVCENACVKEYATIYENAVVRGYSAVGGNAMIGKDAMILESSHYLIVGPLDREAYFPTFFRAKDRTIRVTQGGITYSIDEFINNLNPHLNSYHVQLYALAIIFARSQIDVSEEDS